MTTPTSAPGTGSGTVRLALIAPAMNRGLREARFDDAGPLEPPRDGSVAPLCPGPRVRLLRSPSPRCAHTAALLGHADVAAEPALAGCAMGRWRGRSLDELSAGEPESVAAWLSDPAAAPHGGESLRELRARVADWMDALEPGTVIAFAEADVIRAGVAHALGAPEAVFWRLDVRPLERVELSGRSGRWNVRLGAPAG
ncbi:histidine phosphatase family protein [Streptomyces sp. NPDC101191]|uniref:histidine phosphatase family protein n=1 Tax=Streptomyces sp. NPDC101191 TaxID=3366126 RepID=UPI0038290565